MFWSEDHLASLSQLPDFAEVLRMSVETSCSNMQMLQLFSDLNFSVGRMSLESFQAEEDKTLRVFWDSSRDGKFLSLSQAGEIAESLPESTAHTESLGPSVTLSTSEWPKDAAVCSLSDTLETGDVPRRFFLSPRACAGILRRAEKRGKALPYQLERALTEVVATEKAKEITSSPRRFVPRRTVRTVLIWRRSPSTTAEDQGGGDLVPTLCSDHAGRPSDYSPVVSGTLQSSGKAAGSATQQDAEAGMLIAMTLNAKGEAGRLDGESETLIPIVYDTTHITSKANRSNPKLGDPSHTLAAGAHPPLLARSLTARNDGSPCADRGPDIIPVGFDAYNGLETGDIAATLGANTGQSASHAGPSVLTSGVRRLTPRECERLQGFPDDWTLIPWRGKMAPDGPRYKACGNSFAVNVIQWVGIRICMVEGMEWEKKEPSQDI